MSEVQSFLNETNFISLAPTKLTIIIKCVVSDLDVISKQVSDSLL